MQTSIEQKNSTEEQDESISPEEQAPEKKDIGYGCICGFKTTDKTEFTGHVMRSALADGKGTHKSIGRVNMVTGEIIDPPWAERSADDRRRTGTAPNKSSELKETKKEQPKVPLGSAQQIRVVPRVFTIDYTPIMRMAQDASIEFFDWRPDMPLENFLDTILYMFFKEHGITLCGYIVDESIAKKEGDNGHRT